MNLLIVESPAKAKTIGKYLESDFKVLSSYGHIRGLPSKEGAVDPENDFAMHYELMEKSLKHVNIIVAEAKKSDVIYLATDPDREGEAISWHILEVLKDRKVIKESTIVKRAAFYEITKNAILEAVKNARELDMNLVKAQQTRQGLDYLVGFNVSPVLWRKLPGSKSAGRVQSVALRMICEREIEIENFVTEEYWSVIGRFVTGNNESFEATLIQFADNKLEKLSIKNELEAEAIVQSLNLKKFRVKELTKKQIKKNPHPPFSTSTLIQEASRKLGFSSKKISQVAQKLYEGVSIGGELLGLITYMRTDSIRVSPEAVKSAHDFILECYGKEYAIQNQHNYKNKAKITQEAHEAIRPTNVNIVPDQVKHYLDEDQYRAYSLIWSRFVASQMACAVLDVLTVEVVSEDNQDVLRASGSTVLFHGFYKVYKSSSDVQENLLPNLKEEEGLLLSQCDSNQHFTQGPPRYTEASLVKRMEELGIGRPSTYASIISILQDRQYIVSTNKRFFPQDRGRLVSTFLTLFFHKYVEYDFTANLENQLDRIASNEVSWKIVMNDFWFPFKQCTNVVLETKTSDILEKMEQIVLPYVFHSELLSGEKSLDEVRNCSKCGVGKLVLKNGKFGSFLGCSNYPTCGNVRNIALSKENDQHVAEVASDLPRVLGQDLVSGEVISVRKGPYGLYLQRGDGKNAKRSSIGTNIDYKTLSLEQALVMLSLPRELGLCPKGIVVKAGDKKFGPYLEYAGQFFSLKKTRFDALSISLKDALEFLEGAVSSKKASGTQKPVRTRSSSRAVSAKKSNSNQTKQ